jgi:hypothetical protein
VDIKVCPEEGGFENSACLGGGGAAHAGGMVERRRLEHGPDTHDDETIGLYCREGMIGPRCAVCESEDEHFVLTTQRCETCPPPARAVGIIIGICAGLLVAAGLLYWIWVLLARMNQSRRLHLLRMLQAVWHSMNVNAKFKARLAPPLAHQPRARQEPGLLLPPPPAPPHHHTTPHTATQPTPPLPRSC